MGDLETARAGDNGVLGIPADLLESLKDLHQFVAVFRLQLVDRLEQLLELLQLEKLFPRRAAAQAVQCARQNRQARRQDVSLSVSGGKRILAQP